jgi:hypothetical protein
MVTSWFLNKLSSKIYIHVVLNIIKTLIRGASQKYVSVKTLTYLILITII